MNKTMCDLETLGRKPGCIILSIGAVRFSHEGLAEQFYEKIDIASSAAAGLTIEPETQAWWDGQSAEARAEVFSGGGASVQTALLNFVQWYTAGDTFWCHGATFDAPILEHAIQKVLGIEAPWKFYEVRDTRTLYELADVSPDRSKGTHHNALHDAINQAEAAIASFKKLGHAVF